MGQSRFVVAKIEVSDKGDNPRFIVTSLLEEKAKNFIVTSTVPEAKWKTESKISS